QGSRPDALGRLAVGGVERARDVRHVRDRLPGSSGPPPHPDAGRLHRRPAPQGASALPRLSMSANLERSEEHPDLITVNMGPSHPATHGVLRIVLQLNGEEVVKAVPHLGYLHRGMEKIAEERTYLQFIPYTDRMDYLSPLAANVGFCLA